MKALLYSCLILILVSGCKNNNQLSDAYGNFEADEVFISAEANGQLLWLSLEEGQKLKKNELVGLIDTTQIFLKKKQLNAQLGLISAKFLTIKAQVEVQEKQKANLFTELQRLQNLLKDGAATSKQMDDLTGQIELLNKQIDATKTQYAALENEKQLLLVQLEQAQDQLDKCRIINRVEGTVLQQFSEPNELVNTGKNLYKIADLTEMELRAYISGMQLPHVKLGQQVKVYIDEGKKSKRELTGTVGWISSSAEFTPKIIQTKEERVNLVYAVKINVKNDGSLKIGMPGEVVF